VTGTGVPRGATRDAAPRPAAPPRAEAVGGGLLDLLLVLAIAAVVAAVAVVVFGPQLAAVLDFIGAQVQQPG
jgi:hypothetical protein